MKIYRKIKDFLFLDIETVREYRSYLEMTQHRSADLWEKVGKRFVKEENLTIEETYEKKAALYVEYGKIVSICVGGFDSDLNPKVGAIPGDDEFSLLTNFSNYINKVYAANPNIIIVGHNIKEFDIPYIIKRMIKHKIRIPKLLLDYLGAKSWEVPATDTQYDWRMAGNRFMSLDGIAEFLGIPSSKEGEVKGENLGEFYWNDPQPMDVKIQKINVYCKADVRVCMDFAKQIYDLLPPVE